MADDTSPRSALPLLVGGLALALGSFLGYFIGPVVNEDLRDQPALSALAVALGGLLAGAGAWRVLAGPGGRLVRAGAVATAGFALMLGGLFPYYVYHVTSQLPDASGAPAVGEAVPALEGWTASNEAWSLSGQGRAAVVIFYRGIW